MTRRAKILIGAGAALLALLVAAALYLRSERFHLYVQGRILEQIENATGGRVELRGYRWNVEPLEAELQGLVVRGRETDRERPLFAADTVFVRLKIISLLQKKIDWRLLRVTRPRIHIEADSAGRLNFPEPKRKRAGDKRLVEKILDMAIDRLEVADGELLWNDRRLPLEFTAENLAAYFNYDAARDLYDGRLSFRSPLLQAIAARRGGSQRGAFSLMSEVDTQLLLGRNTLEIPRLTWKTQRSSLTGNGRLFEFAQPKFALNYEARVDVAETGAVSLLRELQGGQANLQGALSYEAAGHKFTSDGDLRFERVAVSFPEFRLTGIYGRGKYHATRDAVEVPAFRTSVLGGELAGSFRADHFDTRPEMKVTARARGISVAELARTFARPELPLTELHWAGAVEGDVRARFRLPGGRGSGRDTLVESSLIVRPPTAVPPGFLPVSGQAEMAFASAAGKVELRKVLLQTPASQISAEGALAASLGSEATDLKLVASTTNYNEWAPVVNALRSGKEPLPLELLGRADFRGSLRGALRAPRLEGRLETAAFRYGDARWTRFAGNLAYSADLLRISEGELRRDGSSARVNLSAQLEHGEITEHSPFSLQAEVEGANLADLQALAGTAYPVTGRVDGSLKASGTRQSPQGGGSVHVTNGTLMGEPFDDLRAGLQLDKGELRTSDLVLKKGAAQVTGQASYREADGSYSFQFTGTGLSLAEIERLRSDDIRLSGAAGFRASGSGTLQRPSFDATVEIADLEVNGERVGKLAATLERRDARLNAQVQSQFLQGTVAGKLSAELAGDYPLQGRLDFTRIDLDPLFAPAVRGSVTTHSTSTGSVAFSGPLKKPEALAVNAEIGEFRVSVEQVEVHNEGPLQGSYRNGQIQIEQAHLAGAETDFRVTGTLRVLGPPAARSLNLRAKGEMNMAFLRTLNNNLIGSGKVTLDAAISGTLRRPLLDGRAEVHNGGVALEDFPTGLSRMEGSVIFDASRLRIEKLAAQAGGGSVQLTGLVDYGTGSPVFRLHAEAEEVRLRYPEGTSSLITANLNLTGTTQQSLLSGDVVVTRASFTPRFDLASGLGLVRAPPRQPITSPLLYNLQIDVRVISSPELRFELSQARDMQVEANLRLRGTAARPSVLGRVDVLQGEISFAGTKYVVNRGEIVFVNPFQIKPEVSLDLQTRVQQYDISITLSGELDKLNVSYRSEPPLPSSDIQALLVTGRAREGVTGTQQSTQPLPALGTNTILSQALNAAVGSRIERLFGVGRLKIDPQVGGPETNPGARVTLEQQVTPDVKFTYITNLASAQQQVVQVEWIVNARWSVIAVRDRNGLFGIDLKWRKRFR